MKEEMENLMKLLENIQAELKSFLFLDWLTKMSQWHGGKGSRVRPHDGDKYRR